MGRLFRVNETMVGEEAVGFLGVNLRRDRMTLADEELAKAINADLHTQVGSIILRLGRTKQFSTALTDLVIRRLAKVNSRRYQIAGQAVYRNQISVLTGLSSNLFSTIMGFRPLNDTTLWAFIADDALMRKDDGTIVRTWGIAVPSAPTVALGISGGLTGAYSVRLTGIRFSGSSVAHESNPSTASTALTLANDIFAIGDIATHADAQVTGLGVYRTVAGGAVHLLDRRAAYPTSSEMGNALPLEAGAKGTGFQHQFGIPLGSISVGQAWGTQTWEPMGAGNGEDTNGRHATHLWEISASEGWITTQTKRYSYGSTTADSALGAAVETDNDVPPAASWATEFQGHAMLCREAANAHYLRFSKRFRPESFPPDNFIEIGTPGDPLQCAIPLAGMLGVFSRLTKYRVLGSTTAGFAAQEALSRRGTPAPAAVRATERGIVFPARDGVFLSNLIAPDEELSAAIAQIFFGESVNGINAINWAAASTMAAETWKGRYYLSLPTGTNATPDLLGVYSRDTGKWYFYDHPCRSLFVEEDSDDLVAGFTDGFAYILEDGTSDSGTSITLDAETKDYSGGAPTTRKLFLWLRVDADMLGDSLTVEMYVDGALKHTATVTGSRTRALLPFPEGAMGYVWRARLRYTGIKRIRISAVEAIGLPLEAA